MPTSLASGYPSLVGLPATLTLPQGYSALSFSATTAPVFDKELQETLKALVERYVDGVSAALEGRGTAGHWALLKSNGGHALAGEALPVYGRGEQVRDWLFVDDHARALQAVFEHGQPGRRYAIGGNAERRNIDVVETLCATLDRLNPRADGRSYAAQIAFVADRPGHDQRYAIDASRIRDELGWAPRESFDTGLEATVRWYLDNEAWWRPIVADRAADVRRGLAA